MKIAINFNQTKIITFSGVTDYSESDDKKLISFFFNRYSDLIQAKFSFNHEEEFVEKITESDNNDYSYLRPIFKLYVVLKTNSYSIKLSDEFPDITDALDSLFNDKPLYILLKNDTSKRFEDMEVIDLDTKNQLGWTKIKNCLVTSVFTREEKEYYINKYYRSLI